jgi:processive 1,2-diacylglycerol beta-glucosyltransferase
VAAMLAAGESAASEPMNVGCGAETSVVDLGRALAVAAGRDAPLIERAAARAGEVARSSLDAARARQTLGFTPRWSLVDGLRATYEYYAAEAPVQVGARRSAVSARVLAGATATATSAPAPRSAPAGPILELAEQHVREVENSLEPRRPARILILSADVGEGHAAAARAMAAEVAASDPTAEIEVAEGLQWLGRVAEHVIRDGYRVQLRFFPWMYGLLYDLFTKVAPARTVGRGFLRLFTARRLLRRVRSRDPDVVISTHPAMTNVLGILRKQGRLTVPVMATITDLADHVFWAHKGCDLHLVCYEQAVERIEPITGAGSVRRVRPLVSPQFLEPCDRGEARERLGLPAREPIVLVSGGGWGVGDLDGAVTTALTSVPGALVVVLAGRNQVAGERLNAAFGDEPRVRILGFTKDMSDLMGAADALIHSTGGVTAMEALLRRCPVIAYGAPWGHARVNARIAEGQGLGLRAESLDELHSALRSIFDGRFTAPEVPPAPPAAPLVLDPRSRVSPRPQWAMRASRLATTAVSALLVVGWTLNSDDAYSLVAKTLHAKPLTRVATQRPQVGLVLRVPREGVAEVNRVLAARNAHGTFALRRAADRGELATMTAGGNDIMPELTEGKTLHWLKTRRILKHDARDFALPKHFYFLAPKKGFNLGEYFYGRVSGAKAVDGAVRMTLPTPRVNSPVHRGQVVVVTIDPRSPGSIVALDELLATFARGGLAAVSLDDLAGSAAVPVQATG